MEPGFWRYIAQSLRQTIPTPPPNSRQFRLDFHSMLIQRIENLLVTDAGPVPVRVPRGNPQVHVKARIISGNSPETDVIVDVGKIGRARLVVANPDVICVSES